MLEFCRSRLTKCYPLAVAAVLFAAAIPAMAGPILDPTAPSSLSLFSLGAVQGVAAQYTNDFSYQGITIDSNNLLLSVGNAGSSIQHIFSAPLIRTNNHITGLGSASLFGSVVAAGPNTAGNVIAGGLIAGPDGTLFTTQGYSYLGQSTGGSTALLDVTGTGVFTGGAQYVPHDFTGHGAGQLKVSSVLGDWYTLNLGGAFGSFTLSTYTRYSVGVGAYAFDYMPADATFPQHSVIVGDSATPGLTVFALDANGNPCPVCATPRHVVTGNIGIGYGVVRDPVTGDILFTTQNNDLWLLGAELGDVPEPGTLGLGIGGIALVALLHRKRHTA